MKKIFGNLFKKSFSLCILAVLTFFQCPAYSYETVLIDFPNGGWHRVYYELRKNEGIVQYVPSNQTRENFLEAVVFHSYKYGDGSKRLTPTSILDNILYEKSQRYGDVQITRLKDTKTDSIVIWCSVAASQCEIFRSSQSYEGIITMHYINNNPQYFQSIYPNWLEIIKSTKIYYSYYRWNAMFNKYYAVIL